MSLTTRHWKFVDVQSNFHASPMKAYFDLHLNTGEFAGFFNLPSFLEFVYQSATFNEALYKVFATKYPSSVKAVIDGVRRAPNSYCDLHYYSQTCREFNALDGRKRYCKFRLVPYGDGPGTEVKDEPLEPNLEDQHTITTTHMMKCRRSAEEKRPTDYLRREFIDARVLIHQVPLADSTL